MGNGSKPLIAKSRLTEAARRPVRLDNVWDKPEEAAKWHKELEAQTKPAEKSSRYKRSRRPLSRWTVSTTCNGRKAAGGVLTAKQAPAGPAPPRRSVCAPGRCAAILSQINLERETGPRHSTLACRASNPPSHWAEANTISSGGARNDVRILRGDGDDTFSVPEHFAAGPGAYAVAAGDFNRDGWLDVATANTNGNNASVLINDRSWTTSPLPLVSVSDATVTEGNTGTLNATFTLPLSHASDMDVTVPYDTADIDAVLARQGPRLRVHP